MEITYKLRTSFKVLASKKATKCQLHNVRSIPFLQGAAKNGMGLRMKNFNIMGVH